MICFMSIITKIIRENVRWWLQYEIYPKRTNLNLLSNLYIILNKEDFFRLSLFPSHDTLCSSLILILYITHPPRHSHSPHFEFGGAKILFGMPPRAYRWMTRHLLFLIHNRSHNRYLFKLVKYHANFLWD